ncbi:MAG: TonB-dependent receptor domain-containing protein, partial [Terriglobales bacterium]
VGSNLSVTMSAYRAFRSPTLNELYRSFRVGNVLTQANSDLRAERLTGAEAGVNAFTLHRKLNLRGTFFAVDIVNPIANVTLSTTPSLITRQRQNLGRTRTRGVEIEAVARLSDAVELSSGYQFVDATVARFPANTTLEGLQIPQVPRHQWTVQARYWKPTRLMLSVQGRWVGAQFEDDQNRLLLDRYFTLDLLAGRSLRPGVEIYAAFENLFNQRYAVGLTPVPTLGPPLLARVGFRFRHPARD